MEPYVWVIIGILFGSLVSNVIFAIRSGYGTLRIDHSNPEKDVYLIEFNRELERLSNKHHVVLTIDNHADLSQK